MILMMKRRQKFVSRSQESCWRDSLDIGRSHGASSSPALNLWRTASSTSLICRSSKHIQRLASNLCLLRNEPNYGRSIPKICWFGTTEDTVPSICPRALPPHSINASKAPFLIVTYFTTSQTAFFLCLGPSKMCPLHSERRGWYFCEICFTWEWEWSK